MPVPKRHQLMDALKELKEYFDRLKKIDGKRKQAEEVLRKIEEVRKALKDDKISEREAFGLLRLDRIGRLFYLSPLKVLTKLESIRIPDATR